MNSYFLIFISSWKKIQKHPAAEIRALTTKTGTTNILRCFKHLFAAYITKCISIISDYVRQRHISVVFVCVSVCVITCTGDFLHFESNTHVSVALRLFFLPQMKNGNAVYDLVLPSSAKIFPRSVHLSPSFTSRLADDPTRRLPRLFFHCLSAFPDPRLDVLGVALSVCRSLLSHATSYHYRSAHVGEIEIILINFLFALMLMQLWWNQKPEWLALSLIFIFFKYRTTDTDTS